MARDSSAAAFCFRHPTASARRRCYHCARAICPACQLRLEGHIFCSEECAREHRRVAFWKRLAKWNRTALQGHWFRAVLLLCIVAAGAAAIWFAAHADRFVEQPELPLPTFKKPGEKGLDQEHVNWDVPGAVYIESPAAGAVLRENRVAVSGKAPEEAMVGLYVNGEKVDVQMAREGTWRFENIPLTGTRNVLQARFFDNRGNSAFGPAVWVDLEARPAAVLARAEVPAAEPTPEAFNLIRAPVGNREILLTFDGGSNANATPSILDTLKSERVKATFFLSGEYMQRYPDLVRRIASEGHVVGNHTFSHPHLTSFSFNGRHTTLAGVTEEFLKSQLERTNDLFKLIAGRAMDPYWRAPFGEFNQQILRWARDAGYTHVFWTPYLDTMDWVSSPEDPLFRTPQQILAQILAREAKRSGGVDGGVVLMHLGSERKDELRADRILPELIARLKAKSYRFATVDEVPGPPGNGDGRKAPATPP